MPRRARTPEDRAKAVESQRRYRAGLGVSGSKAAYRRNNLKNRYGITPEQFDEIFVSQGSCCGVCKSKHARHRHGWRVDHDHVTGKVRGILCNHCNLALGFVGEDPDIVFKIAVYLKVHS